MTYEQVRGHLQKSYDAGSRFVDFEGTEYLALDMDKRSEIIDRVIEYKKKGYPIMNSVSGLKLRV